MKLFFVSSNIHKFQEIEQILNEYHIQIKFHQHEVLEIQSDSLEEIALFRARQAFSELHEPLFVEDTGLFIECLNGFPGPYASYVFKTIGNSGVLQLLKGKDKRGATFRTATALIISDTKSVTFIGETKGVIAHSESINKGWGYDPIFIPNENDNTRTYAQMTIQEKNQVSHRRKSIGKMAIYWNTIIKG